MSQLPEAERRALLELARNALTDAVLHSRIGEYPLSAGRLAEPAGVFVSIHHQGRLRGCLGKVEPIASVAEAVAFCASCVARDDPRFEPVRPDELTGLEIEISVLSRLEAITAEQIEVGRHGLLVRRGPFRGLLLPQVPAHYNWSREKFLEETCLKAGLERDAWKSPDTRIEAFTAEVFSEAEFPLKSEAKAG
ncbi:MAG TPA: AmmeMemoRadiSam system protein A [Candidatus Acidoferrales bacterium]|nr:AmmeMemoRadiSam system protein A [Candidatus Acidoferrales bacterium]